MDGFGFRRRELPPVDISQTEREAVSTDPRSFVQQAMAGLQSTGQGFVRASDIATSGRGTFGTMMGGMERRAKFREEQAGRAAKLMSLSQSAIQGRQQQEVISLKAQEDEQVEMLRQRFAGMAPDEILRAAPPEMQTTDAFGSFMDRELAPGRVANELLQRKVQSGTLKRQLREQEVMEEPEMQKAAAEAVRNTVHFNRAKSAGELKAATQEETHFGVLRRLAKAGIKNPEDQVRLKNAMFGDNRDAVRSQVDAMGELQSKWEDAMNAGLAVGMEVDDTDAALVVQDAYMQLLENGVLDEMTLAEIATQISTAEEMVAEAKAKEVELQFEQEKAALDRTKSMTTGEGRVEEIDKRLAAISLQMSRAQTALSKAQENGDVKPEEDAKAEIARLRKEQKGLWEEQDRLLSAAPQETKVDVTPANVTTGQAVDQFEGPDPLTVGGDLLQQAIGD